MGEIRELLKRREEELTAFLHKTEAAYDEKNYPGRLRISNVGDRTRYYQIVRSPGQGQKDIYLSEKTQIHIYEENGMYAGETMLYTMETANIPFSTKSLDAMIERYLL